MDDLEKLQRIVAAVRQANVDIAPSYLEYYKLAMAIARSCGEAGRSYFHELCSYCPKYESDKAERLFTDCLDVAHQPSSGKPSQRKSTIGTVYYLATQAGVTLHFSPNPPFPQGGKTHTRVIDKVYAPEVEEDVPPEAAEIAQLINQEEERFPGCFPQHEWPPFIQQVIDRIDQPAQKDLLLLAVFTVLGASINRLLYFYYNSQRMFPTLQCLVLGNAASGKGVAAWVRQIGMPFHEEFERQFNQAYKEYLAKKRAWDVSGMKKAEMEMPVEPIRKLFFIPGNNSATGIKSNLIDSDGIGIIYEAETDTVSSSNNADYGHYDDTMRKGFEHDVISYYRKTDHEYKYCENVCLSMFNTGTPSQLAPFLNSRYNGTFSRLLTYHLPNNRTWINQFSKNPVDYKQLFHGWGVTWKSVLDNLRKVVSSIEVTFSDEQEQAFNELLSKINAKAYIIQEDTMVSTSRRLGVNIARIMSIVALMRVLGRLEDLPKNPEALLKHMLQSGYFEASKRVAAENAQDGAVSCFTLTLSNEDFFGVLNLAEPLYEHACRVLSIMPEGDNYRGKMSKGQLLFSKLPTHFTRQQALEVAKEINISPKAMEHLIDHMIEQKLVVRVKRGEYMFTADIKERAGVCNKSPEGE